MSKKKTPFAICPKGKLYVRTSAVMHPLCAACDGIPVTFFGKEDYSYLEVDVAIEWCQREKLSHDADKYETIIELLERFKREQGAEATP